MTRVEKNLTQRRLRGPSIWKDTLKNALRERTGERKDRTVKQT